MPDDRKREYKLAAANQGHPKECGTAYHFRIVQVPIDTRILEMGWEVVHEEITEEPA